MKSMPAAVTPRSPYTAALRNEITGHVERGLWMTVRSLCKRGLLAVYEVAGATGEEDSRRV